MLLPEFRGANLESNPKCTEACGSLLVKQDIKDAIEQAIILCDADRGNVFLLGGSGGGHMAMLMAGFCSELFKAIGAFCGISDVHKWSTQNKNYTKHILACCSDSKEEMLPHSTISYIDEIAKANIKLFHGKFDKSIPVTHTTELYAKINEKYPEATVYLDIFDGGHCLNMEMAMFWILSQYSKSEKDNLTN